MRDRVIPFEGASNFRDLGGHATADGGVTRWGRLYRSDALADLSARDLVLFRQLRIATVIDLRSVAEVQRTNPGLLAGENVRFVHPAVTGPEGATRRVPSQVDGDYLWRRYVEYLEESGAAFARALDEMLDDENYPLVFHCFWGKDRTGVLAALVLGCLGVASSTIVEDYALTHSRTALLIEKLRRDELYREALEHVDPVLLGADGSTMSRFLEELDQRYGGVRGWAARVGLGPSQLETLAELLLE